MYFDLYAATGEETTWYLVRNIAKPGHHNVKKIITTVRDEKSITEILTPQIQWIPELHSDIKYFFSRVPVSSVTYPNLEQYMRHITVTQIKPTHKKMWAEHGISTPFKFCDSIEELAGTAEKIPWYSWVIYREEKRGDKM